MTCVLVCCYVYIIACIVSSYTIVIIMNLQSHHGYFYSYLPVRDMPSALNSNFSNYFIWVQEAFCALSASDEFFGSFI